jgi:hypothetical protein
MTRQTQRSLRMGLLAGLSFLLASLSLLLLVETRAHARTTAGDEHHVPPSQQSRWEQVRQAPVVVVSGSADHMDHVLGKAQMKFVVVSPEEIPNLPLHSQQVLMVNCRGTMSAAARDRVRRFVAAGGFLYTTDHAVHELIEKIFPRTVAWNRQTSNEAIFPMRVHGQRGLLRKLGSSASQQWQLAGGGYLIKVLDPKRVEVLMDSEQVAKRYNGAGVLGVRFRYQDGVVIHVTGHFFTQPGQSPLVARAGRAFEQLSANVVAEKKDDGARIDSLYRTSARRAVKLQAAPSAAAPAVAPESVTTQEVGRGGKVRVLGKKGGYLKVRDQQGNEGWVDGSAF